MKSAHYFTALFFTTLCAILIFNSQYVAAVETRTLTVESNTNLPGQNLALAAVTSSPAGINCGLGNDQCSAQFEVGTEVILTAQPINQSDDIASRWLPYTNFHASPNLSVPYMKCAELQNDSSAVTESVCTAPMPSDDVSIKFEASYIRSTVSVSKSGEGSGIVSNQNPVKPPLLINCGTVCKTEISSSIILFAIPDQNSVFAGWDINGESSRDCGPANYSQKCLTAYQVDVKGSGGNDDFVAIFDKATSSVHGSSGQGVQSKKNDLLEEPVVQIQINGRSVSRSDKPTLEGDEKIVLSGKTFANGIVKVYVSSTMKTYETIANKEGNWKLIVGLEKLAEGKHHIEVDVTDSVTNRTSPRSQVLTFKINMAEDIDQAGLMFKDRPISKLLILLSFCSVISAITLVFLSRGKNRVHQQSGKTSIKKKNNNKL